MALSGLKIMNLLLVETKKSHQKQIHFVKWNELAILEF